MWETILDVIVKYWVNFLLAGVIAVAAFIVKRYVTMSNNERKEAQRLNYQNLKDSIINTNQEMIDEVVKQSNLHDDILQGQIDIVKEDLSKAKTGQEELKAGLLSIQGKDFRANCRELLKSDHIITIDEWEELVTDHEAYNGLGGNHKGDQLFDMVRIKAEHTFADDNKKMGD